MASDQTEQDVRFGALDETQVAGATALGQRDATQLDLERLERDRDAGPSRDVRDGAWPPPPDAEGVRFEQVVHETTFSPGRVLIMLAGAAALALGIVALAKGGLGGDIHQPVVDVFGFAHTPLLGVVEAAVGVVLLLCGLRSGLRHLAALIGALLIVAGVVVLADLDWVHDNLGAEREFAWVPMVIGAVALLGAYGLPWTTRRRVVVTR